jgi:hypothetical protein
MMGGGIFDRVDSMDSPRMEFRLRNSGEIPKVRPVGFDDRPWMTNVAGEKQVGESEYRTCLRSATL